MGRQTQLIQANTPTAKRKYRFTLSHAVYGTLVLKYAPDGWKEDEYVFRRDMKRFGVFRKFAQREMKFIKDGKDYLMNCYESFGINCDVSILVEVYSYQTGAYSTRFNGKIDFTTYKVNDISVDVQIKDGGFTDLLLSRESIPVDIIDATSVDGATITPAAFSTLEIPDIYIGFSGYLTWAIPLIRVWTGSHVVPVLPEFFTNFTELVSPLNQIDDNDGAFFANATQDYIGTECAIVLKLTLRNPSGHGTPNPYNFNIKTQRLHGGTVTETIDSYNVSEMIARDRTITYIRDLVFNIDTGDYIVIEIIDNIGGKSFEYVSASISLRTEVSMITGFETRGITYGEAWRAVVAKLTGQNSAFNSSVFDSETLGLILSTRYFRQIEGLNPSISITLADLFDSLSIFNIGMGVENDTVIVERMEYFFDNHVILDLSGRINPSLIEKSVIPELYMNRLRFGFNSYEYDFAGGVYEFNTDSAWSTVIKNIDSEFAIASPFRGDTSGMFKAIQETDSTKDQDSDSDIFMLDVVEGSETDYIARTDQGFDLIAGAVNSSALFNINYSPANTLRRWGQYIRAALHQNIASFIRWQSSGKNTTLSSQQTGLPLVIENTNIQVSELDSNLWIPEAYTVETPLKDSDFFFINANPNGLIKLADGIYGWILEYKSKNVNKKATLRLLRCNLQAVTPIPYNQLGYGMLYNWFAASDLRNIAAMGWRAAKSGDLTSISASGRADLFRWLTLGYRAEDGTFEPTDIDMDGNFWSKDEYSELSGLTQGVTQLTISATEARIKEQGHIIRLVRPTILNDGIRGTYTGNDGKTYETVAIDGLEWMTENLAETKFRLIGLRFKLAEPTPDEANLSVKLIIPNVGTYDIAGFYGTGTTTEVMYLGLYDLIVENNVYGLYTQGLVDIAYDGEFVILYSLPGSTVSFLGIYSNLIETGTTITDDIPQVTDNSAWAALTTAARCYFNNDSNNE